MPTTSFYDPAINDERQELTVCVVVFKPKKVEIDATLERLQKAIEFLGTDKIKLFLIDNSPPDQAFSWPPAISLPCPSEIISGQGNIGFGRANNIVLDRIGKYHLVLNPDVEMVPSALKEALDFMKTHPECGLLTPAATYPDGRKQYLCKRYPNIFDLFLRGFAPLPVKKLFHKRLNRYEMHDETAEQVFWDPPIVSGCFMLFRGDVFQALKGFDSRYMLYFEDFDISLRSARIARLAYVPSVKIIHRGGTAARKGFWHIQQFIRSGITFFTTYKFKFF